MYRKHFLTICFLMLALLSGCDAWSNKQEAPIAISAPEAAEKEEKQAAFPVGQLYKLAEYSGGLYGSGTQDAYYEYISLESEYSTERLVLKTDFALQKQDVFCAVPGCSHTNSTCPAYIEDINSMGIYSMENSMCLYALESGVYLSFVDYNIGEISGGVTSRLEMLNFDGTQRKTILEFPQDWEVYYEYTDGQALYGVYYVEQKTGGVRVDVSTGEYDIWDYEKNAGPKGCFGSQIIMCRTVYPPGFLPNIVTTNEAMYAGIENLKYQYYLLDLATGEHTDFLELKGDFDRDERILGGCIYWRTQQENGDLGWEKHDISSGETSVFGAESLADAHSLYPIQAEGVAQEDWHYLTMYHGWDDTAGLVKVDLIDTITGEVIAPPLKADFSGEELILYPLAVTKEKDYLISIGNVVQAGNSRRRYALIAQEDFWAANPAYREIEMYTVN